MIPKIIFEDESLYVLNKPYGLTVNNADSTRNQETVQDWIKSINPVTGVGEFFEKNGIVHRLDKDTSGLLIVAKTEQAYLELKKQFQERTIIKKYYALVHGIVEPKEGEINAPIDRNPFNRMHFGVFPGGREAVTNYKTAQQFKSLTLLEVSPKTGRTHQIRVHMKYINHPIVSDPLYVGRKQLREDLKFCPRLFLQAFYLEFNNRVFTLPLDEELKKVIE